MSDARNEIMARIREALKTPSPQPHLKADSTSAKGKSWLPEGGESQTESLALLSENLTKLKAEFYSVRNLDQAIQMVRDLATKKNWKKVAFHKNDLVTPVAKGITEDAWAVDDGFKKRETRAGRCGYYLMRFNYCSVWGYFSLE
jgi:L-lactate utilization protein LutB